MSFQFFISYARDDDNAPPSSDGGKGFVTALRENLAFEFRDKGGVVPEMWWDRRKIAPHEQFDPVIQEGIDNSELLLVIFSRNWLASAYCNRELDMFAQRWKTLGERGVKERIWIVSKQFIDPARRPDLLQGQSSYEFFAREKTDAEGEEQEYFRYGKPQAGYDDVIRGLAQNLWKRAQSANQPKAPQPAEQAPATHDAQSDAGPPSKRRIIYVAKPAGDMRASYGRVVEELERRNYEIRPATSESIPVEDARHFVSDALQGAEASIHLLGEAQGGQPDGCPPIVQLQLELAAERANGTADFKRIVWAPKVLVGENGAATGPERDPLAVVKKFGEQLPSDKVDGSEISAFVEFVVQHLERIAPLPDVSGRQLGAGDSVYLDFSEKDWEYAEQCMEILEDRQIYASVPAFDKEEPRKTEAVNRKKLQSCDAVVLCWAKAPDNWVDSKEEALKDTSKLGRAKPFTLRALVAGPPPNMPAKKVRLRRKQSKGIDVTLDLTEYPSLPPNGLDPLIGKL